MPYIPAPEANKSLLRQHMVRLELVYLELRAARMGMSFWKKKLPRVFV